MAEPLVNDHDWQFCGYGDSSNAYALWECRSCGMPAGTVSADRAPSAELNATAPCDHSPPVDHLFEVASVSELPKEG